MKQPSQQATNMAKVVLRVHSFHCGLVKWADLEPNERKLALSYRLIMLKKAWWKDRCRRFGL